MKSALVTGIAGFAGCHLAELLLSKGFKVHGLYLNGNSLENLRAIQNKINPLKCDLMNASLVKKLIKTTTFDFVFHLAALSSPSRSFENSRQTLENNIISQLNLLEALVEIKSKAKILIIGSADEYGEVEGKYLPITEETTLAPVSPYAVSKVAQDMLGLQFYLHHQLKIVRVRPFNHIGPRQFKNFVVPSFIEQIVNLEQKGGGQMLVGSLENVRDFTDVRDMAKAYLLAVEKGKMGEVYNIGSGKPVKIAKILKILLSLSKVKITVKVDKSRIHQADIKSIYCDYSKFRSQTGWKPKIPLETTLFDTIEYERKKLTIDN